VAWPIDRVRVHSATHLRGGSRTCTISFVHPSPSRYLKASIPVETLGSTIFAFYQWTTYFFIPFVTLILLQPHFPETFLRFASHSHNTTDAFPRFYHTQLPSRFPTTSSHVLIPLFYVLRLYISLPFFFLVYPLTLGFWFSSFGHSHSVLLTGVFVLTRESARYTIYRACPLRPPLVPGPLVIPEVDNNLS